MQRTGPYLNGWTPGYGASPLLNNNFRCHRRPSSITLTTRSTQRQRSSARAPLPQLHCCGAGRQGWMWWTKPWRPLRAMTNPVIQAIAEEVRNPLRGQYEHLLKPLFPQDEPTQKRYPAWPRSYDASLQVSPDLAQFSLVGASPRRMSRWFPGPARWQRLTSAQVSSLFRGLVASRLR